MLKTTVGAREMESRERIRFQRFCFETVRGFHRPR